jgi:hypothetical protein
MRELRRAAYERERGRCAATGLPLGDVDGSQWNMHHRRPGGKGGTSREQDVLSNVVCLLAEAHNMGSPRLIVDGVAGRSVHTDPRWSKPLGLLLSSHENDPSSVPVRVAGVGWVFLTDDGQYVPLG